MPSDLRYTTVVESYAAQQANLVANLLRLLLALWGPFTWWNRPDMVNAYAAQSAVYADIANARSRRLARAFMIAQLRELDALPNSLPETVDSYERGGTPIVEVYKRPARQREHAIRTGKSIDEQVAAFAERLEAIVGDDLANAARDESQKVLAAAPKVIGYRRVIRPEKSRTGTCGLCVVASSKFYTLEELMPLHALCKCTVSAITADADPGLQLNREDLDEIYAAAGSNYAEDLKKIRVQILEHGELGPILRRDGDAFRDVAAVNRDSSRQKFTPFKQLSKADDGAMWDAMRTTSERSIQILEDARNRGTNLVDIAGTGDLVPVTDIGKAIDYHRSLIARAGRHAA